MTEIEIHQTVDREEFLLVRHFPECQARTALALLCHSAMIELLGEDIYNHCKTHIITRISLKAEVKE